MGKRDEINGWRGQVLVVPFPYQGHINPMLQFSKRLVSKGLKVTVVTTLFVTKHKSMQAESNDSITIEAFSDGFDERGMEEAKSIDDYVKRFESVGSKFLEELIVNMNQDSFDRPYLPLNCLIYDSVIPWALNLAKRLGLMGAAFYTQACSVNAINYNVYKGRSLMSASVQADGASTSTLTMIPGLPLLEPHDFPSYVDQFGSYPIRGIVLNQYSNIDEVDWLLFNTFDKLEDEVLSWMAKQSPTRTMAIGPTVPSMYIDKRVEGDNDYGLHLFNPASSDACMKWLDTKEVESVVYVSFGSLMTLGKDQMEELAWGLKRSNYYFLWIVRASEENKFPSKLITAEKGLVVRWCRQLEVLAHRAVGCFVTHCGWNSTLEAMSLGVPVVAMQQWMDQTTNAKFIDDVWRVGVRARVNDKGMVTREEVEVCIKEVMEGERKAEIKRNAVKWKELAKEAVDEDGSSDKNIEEFVAGIICPR